MRISSAELADHAANGNKAGLDCIHVRTVTLDRGDVRLATQMVCLQVNRHTVRLEHRIQRGVREVLPLTRTTSWRGAYDSYSALRAEFMNICGLGR
jgi:hypothetical protein